MKIIRYLDFSEETHFGQLDDNGNVYKIEGNIFGSFRTSKDISEVKKILAPLVPASILCIGLNYRHHAEESKMKIPEFPILFL
ncbi:MAG: 5-carboxymethyl-2-hydroxymuconate isomerase, partial [bacterium]|nr:5-carboxymethyl-2-hydroxymuconate isomerase [bacterium]